MVCAVCGWSVRTRGCHIEEHSDCVPFHGVSGIPKSSSSPAAVELEEELDTGCAKGSSRPTRV